MELTLQENDGEEDAQSESIEEAVSNRIGLTKYSYFGLERDTLSAPTQAHDTDYGRELDDDLLRLFCYEGGQADGNGNSVDAPSEIETHPEASSSRVMNQSGQTDSRSEDSIRILNEMDLDDDLSLCDSERQGTASLSLWPSTGVGSTDSAVKRTARNHRLNVQRSRSVDKGRYAAIRSSQRKVAILEKYVDFERQKCQISGLPCPELPFKSAIDHNSGMQKYETELKTLFFAVASPESLVQLQDIIRAYWRNTTRNSLRASSTLTNQQRLELIEQLEGDSAHIGLVKRCHVHQLFIDNRRTDRTSDGFVISTARSASEAACRKPGNPSHRANATISTWYMKAICPHLHPENPEYARKYRMLSTLRRLGQNLDLFVEKFGYGVIGLLPLGTGLLAGEPMPNVPDDM